MDVGNSAGGSRQLARLVDEYGDVLTADLMEIYQVDLRDLVRPEGRLTPRFLLVLIKGLGMESRFVAEKRGGQQYVGWDEGRYATVAIVNAVRALQYTYVAAHSKQQPPLPDPYPTPGNNTKKKAPKPGSFAGIAGSMIQQARKRREEWQEAQKSGGSPSESTQKQSTSDES